ncbi:cell division regulator GpsB [Lentilactobacillus senioris]|uniref:cell division regulator GpsB n=1 Tax=Lentilactobacillus senioris TaxID=931534 RepID=UPI00227F122C|nr:cell division regulator GpsB [Lentilactobacillus senioris]MCY9806850.1 cell division regulator GpsB [Lentilactobacillus senioris]
MENINYTPNDILQKEFRQKMRGYDPNDVDSFLDDIIKDYESFSKQVQSLEDENERLRIRVDELNKQVTVGGQSTMTRSNSSQPMSSATNMDILKRLSNLERRVFGSQLDGGNNDSHRL